MNLVSEAVGARADRCKGRASVGDRCSLDQVYLQPNKRISLTSTSSKKHRNRPIMALSRLAFFNPPPHRLG
jgi:hypothetical protein